MAPSFDDSSAHVADYFLENNRHTPVWCVSIVFLLLRFKIIEFSFNDIEHTSYLYIFCSMTEHYSI